MTSKALSLSEVNDLIDAIWDIYDEEQTGSIDFDRFKTLLGDIFNASGHELLDSVLEQIKDRPVLKKGNVIKKQDVVRLFNDDLEVYE